MMSPPPSSPPKSPNSPRPGEEPMQPSRSTSRGLIVLPRTENKSSDASKEKPQEIKIPKIEPFDNKELLASRAEGLVGKYVDEFGNVLDWDGTVLGSVEGDLPSMVGRPVSDSGEIRDTSGEVVGYVSENHTKPTLQDLQGGLRVDSSGNIYNQQGKVIGKMHDSPNDGEGGSGSKDSSSKTENKPSSTPGPSEVYLDVKSTHDGIQLIIKIPTVFNKEKK